MIDRRVLANGEIEEWERPATIPDDFIYDPEMNAYYPPGEPTTYDAEAELREIKKLREECRGGVFSNDELRAAGVFNVPKSWRKSLRGGGKGLFDDVVDDDDDDDDDGEAAAPDERNQHPVDSEPDERPG